MLCGIKPYCVNCSHSKAIKCMSEDGNWDVYLKCKIKNAVIRNHDEVCCDDHKYLKLLNPNVNVKKKKKIKNRMKGVQTIMIELADRYDLKLWTRVNVKEDRIQIFNLESRVDGHNEEVIIDHNKYTLSNGELIGIMEEWIYKRFEGIEIKHHSR